MVEPPGKDDLLGVYQALLEATAAGDDPPADLLDEAAELAAGADPGLIESLPTRPKVTMRLLRRGFAEPAWSVLIDSATGVVPRTFHTSTSSGADRADWPLALLTSIEPPSVFAELPGFRDPRFGAPDDAYEIGDAIRLRCHVDDVVAGRRPMLAGWALLDVLPTDREESVAMVARHEGVEVRWEGERRRRPDQVGGSRDALRRRVWSGWRVALDPADLASEGRWTLWLEIGQRGVARRVRIGKSAGELALRAVGSPLVRKPLVALVQGDGGWSLLVAPARRR